MSPAAPAPTVSIIIPTLNGGALFEEVLAALSRQTLKPLELIVVDSGSTDNTAEAARRAGARLISIERRGFDHGGTRAEAARTAKGEILVFMTQDALPADSATIEALVAPLASEAKIAAAYGRQLPSKGATPFAAHLRVFNYPDKPRTINLADRHTLGLRAAFLSNTLAAYRRSALEGIGWFRENLIMGEDTLAAARMLLMGGSVAYVAGAAVYHSHNYSAWQELTRYFDIGVLHRREDWLLKEFGTAGGEGGRFVASELRYLAASGSYHLLPVSFLRNAMKLVGYKCGLAHKALPQGIIRLMSMHKGWWDKQQDKV